MVKSMYKSKSKIEKASPIQKACSKYQRKVNEFKRVKYELGIQIRLRKEQQRRDHNFISIIKEMYPETYSNTVRIYKNKYPNQGTLKILKQKLKEKKT